jgi:hypothetical protein
VSSGLGLAGCASDAGRRVNVSLGESSGEGESPVDPEADTRPDYRTARNEEKPATPAGMAGLSVVRETDSS